MNIHKTFFRVFLCRWLSVEEREEEEDVENLNKISTKNFAKFSLNDI